LGVSRNAKKSSAREAMSHYFVDDAKKEKQGGSHRRQNIYVKQLTTIKKGKRKEG